MINFLLKLIKKEEIKWWIFFDRINKQYYYECPKCWIKSYNRKDIQYKYCWKCHEFNFNI